MTSNSRDTNYHWNPVFTKILEVKYAYLAKFGKDGYYDENGNINESWFHVHEDSDKKYNSILEYWIDKLDCEEYKTLFAIIKTDQIGCMVHISYGIISDLLGKTGCSDMKELWDSNDGFYRECRGLVVDVSGEFIVSSPFKKFFSIGDPSELSIEEVADEIKKNGAEFTNKLDGSMISARYVPEYQSVVVSSSRKVNHTNNKLIDIAYKMLSTQRGCLNLLISFPEMTCIFELISLDDKHIVSYSEKDVGLYLVGMRNTENGVLNSYEDIMRISKIFNVRTTQFLNISFDDCCKMVNSANINDMEGYVININGRLLKFKVNGFSKYTNYLYHDIRPMVISSIIDNTYDDLLSNIPGVFKEECQGIANYVSRYIIRARSIVSRLYVDVMRTLLIQDDEMLIEDRPKNFHLMLMGEHDPNDTRLRKRFYEVINQYDVYIKPHLIRLFNKSPENYLQSGHGKNVRFDDMSKILTVMQMTLDYTPAAGKTQGDMYRVEKRKKSSPPKEMTE